jgi:putative membrane protein
VFFAAIMPCNPPQQPCSLEWLPAFNTALIVISGSFLSAGYFCIRRRWIPWHHRCMLVATVFAALFLVVYVTRAALLGSHPFAGEGAARYIYVGILVPHMLAAIAVGPMALVALARAFRGNFSAHRRIARLTLPIWAFVAISGWIIYLMLYVLF